MMSEEDETFFDTDDVPLSRQRSGVSSDYDTQVLPSGLEENQALLTHESGMIWLVVFELVF